MDSRHSVGSTAQVSLDIIVGGAGVTGLFPEVAIQRMADRKWFQDSDSSWVETPVDNPMIELDSTYLPGRYGYDFDQLQDDLSGSFQYLARKRSTAGTLALEYEGLIFGLLAGAGSPLLCSVKGTIFNSAGDAVVNSRVSARLVPFFSPGQGRALESDALSETYTTAAGDFDLPMVRGGTYLLEIDSIGFSKRILVPDTSSTLFTSL